MPPLGISAHRLSTQVATRQPAQKKLVEATWAKPHHKHLEEPPNPWVQVPYAPYHLGGEGQQQAEPQPTKYPAPSPSATSQALGWVSAGGNPDFQESTGWQDELKINACSQPPCRANSHRSQKSFLQKWDHSTSSPAHSSSQPLSLELAGWSPAQRYLRPAAHTHHSPSCPTAHHHPAASQGKVSTRPETKKRPRRKTLKPCKPQASTTRPLTPLGVAPLGFWTSYPLPGNKLSTA